MLGIQQLARAILTYMYIDAGGASGGSSSKEIGVLKY